MVLNYIWISFFIIAFIVSIYRWLFLGEIQIFSEIMNATFSSAKNAGKDSPTQRKSGLQP